MTVETPAPLAPEEAARLTDFARACKAAARAVMLYPPGHPAIATTLGRIAQVTSGATLRTPLRISVLADRLTLDGRAPARPDAAIAELASLLHAHLIGELTINPGGDAEAWRSFLLLLGRSPESVRDDGGISRVWTTMAGRHVEVREIDYTEVLRERSSGMPAAWEHVIAHCLQGQSPLGDEALKALLEVAADSAKLAQLMAALDVRATEGGHGLSQRAAALVQLLQSIIETVSQKDADNLEPTMRSLASAIGQLSPDMIVSLLSHKAAERAGEPAVVDRVVSHMSDSTIAGFVARHALAEDASIERVAQAFHSLVPDAENRTRLLALAHDEASESLVATMPGFEGVWDEVAQKLLTSYSDKPYVSDDYARELSSARMRAIDVEDTSDDPPERLSAWLSTVSTSEVRKLDLTLVLDLLRIEADHERWSTLMRPVVSLIEDLLMVGDFDGAGRLVAALVTATRSEQSKERRQTAVIAIDVLVAGSMMRHIVTHLATMDDAQFEQVKAMCVSMGEVPIRPLAEALAAEDRRRPRERLIAILMAFGSIGRREFERLRSSPNAAVRRAAITLMRHFAGNDALPELTELLADNEPQVQREAVRAILNIGTDAAYQVLQHALVSGTATSREAIMQSLGTVRDEGAAPLFAYILRNVDHRGQLRSVYLRAIEALATLGDPVAIPDLQAALYRGEWWAPGRTRMLRLAAAAALARIGTSESAAVLDEAARTGSRGVRAAARAHLGTPRGPAR
jgi:HEAT repeat protein